MAAKILSREGTRRLLQFAQDKVEPPVKLTEHKARIEALTQGAERRATEFGGYYQKEVDLIVSMKRALDGLYGDWAEGVERVRWCDLPGKPGLTADDILREAVYATEAVYGADGVETLATYLDTMGYDSLTRRLAEHLLAETRLLLEETLLVEGEAAAILSDPRRFFGATDDEVVRVLVTQRFADRIGRESPDHVKRAMIAYIEFGLGNYIACIRSASFAQNEKQIPNFAKVLYASDYGAAEAELLRVERRKAEILITLLRK